MSSCMPCLTAMPEDKTHRYLTSAWYFSCPYPTKHTTTLICQSLNHQFIDNLAFICVLFFCLYVSNLGAIFVAIKYSFT